MSKVYEVTVKLIVVSQHGQGDPRYWENEQLFEECLEIGCESVELVPQAEQPTNQPTTNKEENNVDA